MPRPRPVPAVIVGLTLVVSAGAHTRERDRIAAFEAAQQQRNGLLTQGVKDAIDATARLEESLKAREAHVEHLGREIDGLRRDMAAGLGGAVDRAVAAVAPSLAELERRTQARLNGKVEEMSRLRGEAVGVLEARQGALDGRVGALDGRLGAAEAAAAERVEAAAAAEVRLDALEKRFADAEAARAAEAKAARKAAEDLRGALAGFRDYLGKFSASVETRLKAVDAGLAAVKAQQEADRKAQAKRVEALLAAVSAENLKLRRGLEAVAGSRPTPRPASGTHAVKEGESWYGIARKYGVDLDALKAANPDLSAPGKVLQPGASVKLPAAE